METDVLSWVAHAPKHSAKDYEAIINDVQKPVRNPAPRGKRIIDSKQARGLYFDLTQEISYQSVDSSHNQTSVEEPKTGISYYGAPMAEDERLTGSDRRGRILQSLRERQLQYHKQEMALGGYHDVFNDTCPDFKPQKFVHEESMSVASGDASQETVLSDHTSLSQHNLLDDDKLDGNANIARSSQGRVGEGCSTPRNVANHTFAPLRTIDVSVVNMQDSDVNERMEKERRKIAEEDSACRFGIHPPQGEPASDSAKVDPNVSLEAVLSKMRHTPKKVYPVVKSKTFTILGDKPRQIMDGTVSQKSGSSSAASNDTFTVLNKHKTSIISHESGDTIENGVDYTAEPLQNETYVVEKNTTVERNIDIPNVEQGDKVSTFPGSNSTSTTDVVFAIPALPKKALKSAKTTVHQREERASASQKNSSILETMNLDLRSPGRTLFAALPRKKQRSLATTPAKARSSHNEDEMETSIVMSDISQQPSVESGDDSVVDPVTDPRPSKTTPQFTQNSTLASLPAPAVTPVNRAKASFRRSSANMSTNYKMEIIQKSVERLSQPRVGGSCSRRTIERCGPNDQISPNHGAVTNCSNAEPLTPFQPIDLSRMFVPNADRSGTARRGPLPKRVNSMMSRSSLFSHDVKDTSKQIRSNLLKRQGDYKPKNSGFSDRAESVHSGIYTSPSVANPEIRQMSPECSFQSTHSPRVPAGRNAVPATCEEVVTDINEDILLDAARRLSLEDASPASANHGTQDGYDNNDQVANCRAAELLMESVFSTNTPGRDPTKAFKRTVDSPELETNPHLSSIETVSPINDSMDSMVSVETDSQRVCSEEDKNENCVMILKPREVVAASTPCTPNVRRSVRNRMKPVRQWLGEKPVYSVSPGGGRTLVGVTEVEVREKRWLKVRTANYRMAQEREQQLAAHRRCLREKRRQEAVERKKNRVRDLHARHRRGQDLHISVDSIVTSSDEDDSD